MRKTLIMVIILSVSVAVLAVDYTFGATPIPTSGFAVDGVPLAPVNRGSNFAHIDVWDFGGRYVVLSSWSSAQKAANLPWYASHVDITEEDYRDSSLNSYMKQYTPNMKVILYRMDHTQFQSAYCGDPMSGCGSSNNIYGISGGEAPDETYYLHFQENTTLVTKTGATVNITGCPTPNPVTKSCRVQTFMWEDWRWVFNVKSTGWRQWRADQLLGMMGTRWDGTMFDEHLPGFTRALYMPGDTRVTTGGGVREYNGLRPYPMAPWDQNDTNQLDREYNTDMANWFAYYRGRLDSAGKSISVTNPASNYGWPYIAETLGTALKGVMYEQTNYPDFWQSWSQYQDYINQVNRLTAISGSKQVLTAKNYFPAVYEPSGYTAGNYDTPHSRYLMWRLANYYILRGMPGSPGTVYFDPELDMRNGGANMQTHWRKAFEYDIGSPTDSASVYATLSRSCASTYKIWVRNYTNGKVFMRPRDSSACTDWDTGTTITVSPAMRRLNADGSFSDYSTTFTLRNAEALILLK